MIGVFYLGIAEPRWLGELSVPMFVSRNRASRTRLCSWPRAVAPYGLDSGGFTELSQHGRWRIGASEYAAFVAELREVVGEPAFVAPMDHMCEPFILARTGRTVAEHQRSTVDNFVELRELIGSAVIPVLQGYSPRDYDRCAELYAQAGVELEIEPLVGVGSVCRRSGTEEANRLLRYIADRGLRLHAFGVKGATWRACASFLASADSMAWSYNARRNGLSPNAASSALAWRDRLLSPKVAR